MHIGSTSVPEFIADFKNGALKGATPSPLDVVPSGKSTIFKPIFNTLEILSISSNNFERFLLSTNIPPPYFVTVPRGNSSSSSEFATKTDGITE